VKYLLDTNICIYIIKRRPESVIHKLRATASIDVAVSTITLAELEYGAAKSLQPDRNRLSLLEFMVPFTIVDFDQAAATHYGLIRAYLESTGTPIGAMDMLIAAQARSMGLTLVTNNDREFRRVDGLALENWAEDAPRRRRN
jgi:tRNA(fMet)-specific endonuclease VapC